MKSSAAEQLGCLTGHTKQTGGSFEERRAWGLSGLSLACTGVGNSLPSFGPLAHTRSLEVVRRGGALARRPRADLRQPDLLLQALVPRVALGRVGAPHVVGALLGDDAVDVQVVARHAALLRHSRQASKALSARLLTDGIGESRLWSTRLTSQQRARGSAPHWWTWPAAARRPAAPSPAACRSADRRTPASSPGRRCRERTCERQAGVSGRRDG